VEERGWTTARYTLPCSARDGLRGYLYADRTDGKTGPTREEGAWWGWLAGAPWSVVEDLTRGGMGEAEKWLRRKVDPTGDPVEHIAPEIDPTCGRIAVLAREEGPGTWTMYRRRCRRRVCLPCARANLRASMSRYTTLFQVPLLPGFMREMFTVGNERTCMSRVDIQDYTRRIGLLCRAMRRGDPRYGIEPHSWAAGLRAIEVVPQGMGLFAHCHIMVVRSGFYPYGLSEDRLKELGRDPTPQELGVRALMRHLGIGEVGQHELLDDTELATSYMAKVAKYTTKAGGEGTWTPETWADPRVQLSIRAQRLLQPFGDALGLTAGPPRRTWYRDGQEIERLTAVVVAHEDDTRWDRVFTDDLSIADVQAPDACTTWHAVRTDTLDQWRTWADVDALPLLTGSGPMLPARITGMRQKHPYSEIDSEQYSHEDSQGCPNG